MSNLLQLSTFPLAHRIHLSLTIMLNSSGILQGCPKWLEAMSLIFRVTKTSSLKDQIHWHMPLSVSDHDWVWKERLWSSVERRKKEGDKNMVWVEVLRVHKLHRSSCVWHVCIIYRAPLCLLRLTSMANVLLSPLKCWGILPEKPTASGSDKIQLGLHRQCWLVNLRNLILKFTALPKDCMDI